MLGVKYLLVVVVGLSGCGGKILEERGDGGAGSGGGGAGAGVTEAVAAGAASAAAPAAPVGARAGDPCATICESNGGCVGGQKDCVERCSQDLGTPGCAAEASAYLGCYADNIQFCSELPPVCESAYCAYALCAGRITPPYCR